VEFILFIEYLKRGLCCPATASGQATFCHGYLIVAKNIKFSSSVIILDSANHKEQQKMKQ